MAANTKFYFWFWCRFILPVRSWRVFWSWVLQRYPSAPVPISGVGKWPKGAESGLSSATSSSAVVSGTQIMQHSLPGVLQPMIRGLHTSLPLPGDELLPRRSRRQGWRSAQPSSGSGHTLGEGFTGWVEFKRFLLCSSLSVCCECSPGCWIPLLKTGDGAKTQVLGLDLLSVRWIWCLSSSARDGSGQEWQWGNTTTTNGFCCIPSPPSQSLGQISLFLSR